MFDLNKEVAKWKKTLCVNDTCSAADVIELESHLYDSMAELKAKGLTEQEAFYIALHRLGSPDVLAHEYGKVNGSRSLLNKLVYAGLGIVVLNIISNLSSILTNGIRVLSFSIGFRPKDVAYLGIAAQIIILLSVLICCYFLLKYKRYGIGTFLSSVFGKVSLVFLTLVLVVGSRVSSMLESLLLVRSIGASEFGQISLISNYFYFGYSIVFPMVIVIFVMVFWHKNSVVKG